MPTAYVLLNCDLGSETEIIKKIKQVPEVVEVSGVFGVYDIIARVNASNDEDLKKAVGKIRGHHGIKSSLTMMVIEGQGT